MSPEKATLSLQNIASKEALLAGLARVDISVPPPSEQRNRQKEQWAVCRLVSTLAGNDLLTYPLSLLVKSGNESPDAVLSVPSAMIGLELTTTPEREFLDALKKANQKHPEGFLIETSTRGARFGSPDDETWKFELPPSEGDEPAKVWADLVAQACSKKLRKLSQPSFQIHDKNWLSIYSVNPIASLINRALSLLVPKLFEVWERTPSFDAIFVEDGDKIICISVDENGIFSVNDLWINLRK